MSHPSADAVLDSHDHTAPLEPMPARSSNGVTRLLSASQLAGAQPMDSAAIRALLEQIQAEQRHTWQRGQRVPVEAYLDAYPALRKTVHAVLLVREEFLLRRELGERPIWDEYEVRFPQLREVLRRELPAGPESHTGRLAPCRSHARQTRSPAAPTIPGYEILDELGRGGMGVVYKARQSGLDRVVALKMIRTSSLLDSESRQRFQGEAQAVARLQHPNIVQIFEVGVVPGDETPYFSLEFVEGGDLRDSLAKRPLEPQRAAELVRTLAAAMHYAHERGIIHRDLKPANVLLTRDGQPKITDFGLAKKVASASGSGTGDHSRCSPPAQTACGMIVGTPEYLAPEQATGVTPVGPAADVYALGVILYETITGRCPFEGRDALEIITQVCRHEPVPIRRLRPSTPRDLETICLKCLDKDPARRYPSAKALAEDLARFSNHEPILARPPGVLGRALRWARRRPAIAALLAVLALTILLSLTVVTAALLYALEGWRTASQEKRAAEEQHNLAVEKGTEALEQKRLAVAKEQEARAHQQRAELRQVEAEKSQYLNGIAAARLEWYAANQARAQHQLNLCLPSSQGSGVRGQGLEIFPDPASKARDHRGWEWYFLRGLLHSDLHTIDSPHESSVNALRFTRDNSCLISAGGNPFAKTKGSGKVWQDGTYRRLAGWNLPSNVLAMDVLADDAHGVCQGWDGKVRIHQLNNGRLVRTFEGGITALACVPENHPDANAVALVNNRGLLQVRDALTGHLHRSLQLAGPPNTATGLAFHPNGYWLAVNQGSRVQIVDSTTGQTIRTLTQPHLHSGSNPAFSPDGTLLAVGNNNQALVWDVGTGAVQYTLSGHSGFVKAVAFSPDCVHLATGSADTTVRVWNVISGQEEQTVIGHLGRVKSLLYHPNGRTLVSGSEQPAQIKVWDVTRSQEAVTLSLQHHKGGPPDEAIAFSPDGRQLLRLGRGSVGNLETCDASTGVPLSARNVPWSSEWRAPTVGAVFSRKQPQLLAAVQRDLQRVEVRDVGEGRLVRTFRFPLPVVQLALSADGRRLAAAGLGRVDNKSIRDVQVRDVRTGQVLAHFQPAAVPFEALGQPAWLHGVLALNEDGSKVAFDDYPIDLELRRMRALLQVHDVDVGRLIHELSDHQGVFSAVVFGEGEGGNYLASASPDPGRNGSRVILTDLTTGRPLHPRPLEGAPSLMALAFHPSANRLALATREQVVLWDVASGQELLTLRGAPVRQGDNGFNPRILWSPDGQRLAATNWNSTVSIWSAATGGTPVPPGQKQNRQEAEQRALRWHLNWSQRVEWHDRALEFHQAQAAQLEPRTPHERLERARLAAQVGAWEAAHNDFRLAWQSPDVSESDIPFLWHERALVLGRAGDVAGMKRSLAGMKERFGASNDPITAYWLIVTACLDRRLDVPEKELLEWAGKLAAEPRKPEHRYALGLIQHRLGQHLETLHTTDGAVTDQSNRFCQVQCLLLQALAHQHLKAEDKAKQCFRRAASLTDERQKPLSSGALQHLPPHLRWSEWLSIQLLLEEARTALAQPAGRKDL